METHEEADGTGYLSDEDEDIAHSEVRQRIFHEDAERLEKMSQEKMAQMSQDGGNYINSYLLNSALFVKIKPKSNQDEISTMGGRFQLLTVRPRIHCKTLMAHINIGALKKMYFSNTTVHSNLFVDVILKYAALFILYDHYGWLRCDSIVNDWEDQFLQCIEELNTGPTTIYTVYDGDYIDPRFANHPDSHAIGPAGYINTSPKVRIMINRLRGMSDNIQDMYAIIPRRRNFVEVNELLQYSSTFNLSTGIKTEEGQRIMELVAAGQIKSYKDIYDHLPEEFLNNDAVKLNAELIRARFEARETKYSDTERMNTTIVESIVFMYLRAQKTHGNDLTILFSLESRHKQDGNYGTIGECVGLAKDIAGHLYNSSEARKSAEDHYYRMMADICYNTIFNTALRFMGVAGELTCAEEMDRDYVCETNKKSLNMVMSKSDIEKVGHIRTYGLLNSKPDDLLVVEDEDVDEDGEAIRKYVIVEVGVDSSGNKRRQIRAKWGPLINNFNEVGVHMELKIFIYGGRLAEMAGQDAQEMFKKAKDLLTACSRMESYETMAGKSEAQKYNNYLFGQHNAGRDRKPVSEEFLHDRIDETIADLHKDPLQKAPGFVERLRIVAHDAASMDTELFYSEQQFQDSVWEASKAESKTQLRKTVTSKKLLKVFHTKLYQENKTRPEISTHRSAQAIIRDRMMETQIAHTPGTATNMDKLLRLKFSGAGARSLRNAIAGFCRRHANNYGIKWLSVDHGMPVDCTKVESDRTIDDLMEQVTEDLRKSNPGECVKLEYLLKHSDDDIEKSMSIRSEPMMDRVRQALYQDKDGKTVSWAGEFFDRLFPDRYETRRDNDSLGEAYEYEDMATWLDVVRDEFRFSESGEDNEKINNYYRDSLHPREVMEANKSYSNTAILVFDKIVETISRNKFMRGAIDLSSVANAYLRLAYKKPGIGGIVEERVLGTTFRLFSIASKDPDNTRKCTIVNDNADYQKVLRLNSARCQHWSGFPFKVLLVIIDSIEENFLEFKDMPIDEMVADLDLAITRLFSNNKNLIHAGMNGLPKAQINHGSSVFDIIAGKLFVSRLILKGGKESNEIVTMDRFNGMFQMSTMCDYEGMIKKFVKKCTCVEDAVLLRLVGYNAIYYWARPNTRSPVYYNTGYHKSITPHQTVAAMYTNHNYYKHTSTGAGSVANHMTLQREINSLNKQWLDYEKGTPNASIGDLFINGISPEGLSDLNNNNTEEPQFCSTAVTYIARYLHTKIPADVLTGKVLGGKTNLNIADISQSTNICVNFRTDIGDTNKMIKAAIGPREMTFHTSLNSRFRKRHGNTGEHVRDQLEDIKKGHPELKDDINKIVTDFRSSSFLKFKEENAKLSISDVIDEKGMNIAYNMIKRGVRATANHLRSTTGDPGCKKDMEKYCKGSREDTKRSAIDISTHLQDNYGITRLDPLIAPEEFDDVDKHWRTFVMSRNMRNSDTAGAMRALREAEERLGLVLDTLPAQYIVDLLQRVFLCPGVFVWMFRHRQTNGKLNPVMPDLDSQRMRETYECWEFNNFEMYLLQRILSGYKLHENLGADVTSTKDMTKVADLLSSYFNGADSFVFCANQIIRMVHDLKDADINNLGRRNPIHSYKNKRSTSTETLGLIAQQYKMADVINIAVDMIQKDDSWRFYTGTAVKEQLAGFRELGILSKETKILMKCVESISDTFLEHMKSDLLANPERKEQFLRLANSHIKSGDMWSSNISGDKSKWGAKHSYTMFFVFFSGLLKDHALRNHFLSQMAAGWCKEVEIDIPTFERLFNILTSYSTSARLKTGALCSAIGKIVDKLKGSKSLEDWDHFTEFAVADDGVPIKSLEDITDGTVEEIIEWLKHDVGMRASTQRALWALCNNKKSIMMISHMIQGITHETSSVPGNANLDYAINVIFKTYFEKEVFVDGTFEYVLHFVTSSDDYCVTFQVPKTKLSKERFTEYTRRLHNIITTVAACCNIMESPKTCISDSAIELYSKFSIGGMPVCATIKQLLAFAETDVHESYEFNYQKVSNATRIQNENGSGNSMYWFVATTEARGLRTCGLSVEEYRILKKSGPSIGLFPNLCWTNCIGLRADQILNSKYLALESTAGWVMTRTCEQMIDTIGNMSEAAAISKIEELGALMMTAVDLADADDELTNVEEKQIVTVFKDEYRTMVNSSFSVRQSKVYKKQKMKVDALVTQITPISQYALFERVMSDRAGIDDVNIVMRKMIRKVTAVGTIKRLSGCRQKPSVAMAMMINGSNIKVKKAYPFYEELTGRYGLKGKEVKTVQLSLRNLLEFCSENNIRDNMTLEFFTKIIKCAILLKKICREIIAGERKSTIQRMKSYNYGYLTEEVSKELQVVASMRHWPTDSEVVLKNDLSTVICSLVFPKELRAAELTASHANELDSDHTILISACGAPPSGAVEKDLEEWIRRCQERFAFQGRSARVTYISLAQGSSSLAIWGPYLEGQYGSNLIRGHFAKMSSHAYSDVFDDISDAVGEIQRLATGIKSLSLGVGSKIAILKQILATHTLGDKKLSQLVLSQRDVKRLPEVIKVSLYLLDAGNNFEKDYPDTQCKSFINEQGDHCIVATQIGDFMKVNLTVGYIVTNTKGLQFKVLLKTCSFKYDNNTDRSVNSFNFKKDIEKSRMQILNLMDDDPIVHDIATRVNTEIFYMACDEGLDSVTAKGFMNNDDMRTLVLYQELIIDEKVINKFTLQRQVVIKDGNMVLQAVILPKYKSIEGIFTGMQDIGTKGDASDLFIVRIDEARIPCNHDMRFKDAITIAKALDACGIKKNDYCLKNLGIDIMCDPKLEKELRSNIDNLTRKGSSEYVNRKIFPRLLNVTKPTDSIESLRIKFQTTLKAMRRNENSFKTCLIAFLYSRYVKDLIMKENLKDIYGLIGNAGLKRSTRGLGHYRNNSKIMKEFHWKDNLDDIVVDKFVFECLEKFRDEIPFLPIFWSRWKGTCSFTDLIMEREDITLPMKDEHYHKIGRKYITRRTITESNLLNRLTFEKGLAIKLKQPASIVMSSDEWQIPRYHHEGTRRDSYVSSECGSSQGSDTVSLDSDAFDDNSSGDAGATATGIGEPSHGHMDIIVDLYSEARYDEQTDDQDFEFTEAQQDELRFMESLELETEGFEFSVNDM